MRIALLTSQWPGVRLGGIGVYTVHCARAFAQAGHEPHIFTLTLPRDAVLPEGAIVHQVASLAELGVAGKIPPAWAFAIRDGGEPLYRLLTATLLCDSVRTAHASTPFDLIEAPEYEALGLPLIHNPIDRVPLITQLHSGTAIARYYSSALLPGNLYESLELGQMLASGALCAPSHAVYQDTSTAYFHPAGFPQPKIIGLPFDASDKPFSAPPPDAPILYIGRLESLKGAGIFAMGIAPFLRAHPTARARVIGPDTMTCPGNTSMQAWMIETFREAGENILRQVTFTGELTRVQIDTELEDCSLVVVPSICESYSYVCCEALAAGRPVIVSDQIGATEVVGNAGISFPRSDFVALTRAITSLWNNPAQITQLARIAYDRARNELSSKSCTQQRIDFFKECIANRTAAPAGLDERTQRAVSQCFRAISGEEPFPVSKGPPSPGTLVTNLLKHYPHPVPFYLYGAGRHTLRLMVERTLWESQGHRAIGIIDDHPRFSSPNPAVFLALPVLSLAAAASQLTPGAVVILSSDAFEEQFWTKTEGLRNRGIVVYRLYARGEGA